MKKNSLLIAILAATALSACSSLSEQTPQQMVQSSVERTIRHDNRFNFDGSMRVRQLPVSASLLNAEQQETAKAREALSIEQASLNVKRDAYREDCIYQDTSSWSQKAYDKLVRSCDQRDEELTAQEEALDKKMGGGEAFDKIGKALAEQPGIVDVLDGATIRVKGAVDLPAAMFEMYSEFDYQNKHERLTVGLPLLWDVNQATLTLDPPTSARAILGAIVEDKALRERLRREPIRADFNEWFGKLPMKTAMKSLLLSSSDAYAALPPEAFQQLPANDLSKRLGADYRISVSIGGSNSTTYMQAFRKAWLDKFDELAKSEPEAGVDEAGYDKVRMFIGMMDNEEVSEALTEQQKLLADSYEFYLDKRARTLGMRVLIQPVSVVQGKVLSLESEVFYRDFGHPSFTLKSSGPAVTAKEIETDYQTQRNRRLGLDTETDDVEESVVEAGVEAVK